MRKEKIICFVHKRRYSMCIVCAPNVIKSDRDTLHTTVSRLAFLYVTAADEFFKIFIDFFFYLYYSTDRVVWCELRSSRTIFGLVRRLWYYDFWLSFVYIMCILFFLYSESFDSFCTVIVFGCSLLPLFKEKKCYINNNIIKIIIKKLKYTTIFMCIALFFIK